MNYINLIILVSENELEIIRKNQFNKLSHRLKGILLAIQESTKVKKFSIALIKKQFESIELESYNKKLIIKIISNLDSFLRKYFLYDPFINFDLNVFNSKYAGEYIEIYNSQKKSSLYKFDLLISSQFLKNPYSIQYYFDVRKYFEIYYAEFNDHYSLNKNSSNYLFGIDSSISIFCLDFEKKNLSLIAKARIARILNFVINEKNTFFRTSSILQVAFNNLVNNKKNSCELRIKDLGKIQNNYLSLKNNYFLFFLKSINNLFTTIIFKPESIIRKSLKLFFNPYHRWNICLKNIDINKSYLSNICSSDSELYKINRWTDFYEERVFKFYNNWTADPFLFKDGNNNFIIYEKYIYNQNKGSIFCREILHKRNKIKLGLEFEVLTNSHHLSYPYVFERFNQNYFIPENSYNGANLYLLRKKKVDGKITFNAKKIKQLIDGFAIDPSLVRVNGYDYLFVSGVQNKFSDVLYVYISKDITKYPLQLHISAPLLVDHTLGRSAGRIFWDKKLKKFIRPSQICKSIYGQGIAFSTLEISRKKIEISEINYKFIPKRNYSKYARFHHIDINNGFLTIDYADKRNELLTLRRP